MNIQQAAEALYQGQMVKRRYWCNSNSISYDPTKDKLIDYSRDIISLTPYDLTATDWEISTSVAQRIHTYVDNVNIAINESNQLVLQGTIVYTMTKSVPFQHVISPTATIQQFLKVCGVKSIKGCNNILVFVECVGDKILTINEFKLESDGNAPLPEHGDEDRVDSSSATLGSPMKIVKYILKEDLKDYKLVKKTKRM